MKNLLILILTVATFNLVAQPANDERANAIVLNDLNSWTSADGAYSNVEATPDGNGSTCFQSAQKNVWFKFQATTNEVEIKIMTGGSKGTIIYAVVSLFNESGGQLSCNNSNSYQTAFIQNTSLTPGGWYYISVDNYAGHNHDGSFTLQIKDQIGFDLKAKALELTDISDWASPDAAYSNVGATPDANGSTCWLSTQKNVWFKFQATTNEVEIKILTGGSKGTIMYTVLSLFNDNGVSQDCNKTGAYQTSVIQNTSLTPGAWYYISVDNHAGSNHDGTFTLQMKDQIGYDLKAKALLLTDISDWTSPDAAYSNVEATPDGNGSTCFPMSQKNVWFKFQATTNEVEIKIFTGGSKGTIVYAVVSLFSASGEQLSCNNGNSYQTSFIQNISLTPGAWYYISVDNYAGSNHEGTFTLQINDEIDYDLKEKAVIIDDLSSWSSADAAYDNSSATPDKTGGSCGAPIKNVWFKFQATSAEIEVKIVTGGSKGTINYPMVTLYDASNVVLSCYTLSAAVGTASIQNTSIIPGAWYYISVDNAAGNSGTFTLTINDQASNDLRANAISIEHLEQWCSANAIFNNIDATRDEISNAISNEYYKNVWFKFQATSNTVKIKVLTGSDKGTLSQPVTHLTDDNGSAIAFANSLPTSELEFTLLQKGSWYYISVATVSSSASGGTFTLCIEGGGAPSQLCSSIYCDGAGNVSIGTPLSATGYKLSVQGRIMAEGVKVELQSRWPDYVFEKEFPLPTLTELDEYIQANGHLPKVPKADEVEKEGIDLGRMNAILLEKIEGITLYLIQQNKEMDNLKKEIDRLKSKLTQ